MKLPLQELMFNDSKAIECTINYIDKLWNELIKKKPALHKKSIILSAKSLCSPWRSFSTVILLG